jgi:hypothetical protein
MNCSSSATRNRWSCTGYGGSYQRRRNRANADRRGKSCSWRGGPTRQRARTLSTTVGTRLPALGDESSGGPNFITTPPQGSARRMQAQLRLMADSRRVIRRCAGNGESQRPKPQGRGRPSDTHVRARYFIRRTLALAPSRQVRVCGRGKSAQVGCQAGAPANRQREAGAPQQDSHRSASRQAAAAGSPVRGRERQAGPARRLLRQAPGGDGARLLRVPDAVHAGAERARERAGGDELRARARVRRRHRELQPARGPGPGVAEEGQLPGALRTARTRPRPGTSSPASSRRSTR